MSRDAAARYALRGLAIVIAVAAVVDPAIASRRASKPEIAVVAADHVRDSLLVVRVSRALEKEFTVIPASFAPASATVLVGDGLPPVGASLALPVFAVASDRSGVVVSIEAARAASIAPLDARVPVSVMAHVTGGRGRTVELSLRAGGLIIDRVTHRIAADDERIPASLSYLPTGAGATPLRVVAAITGGRDSALADLLVDVRDTRWPVLFFDPHPSWMSTFVRRAVERDRRFIVTSRVVTSRNVSTDAGQPPSRLDDLAGVSRFAAIIVGAPDALSESDVNGLDAFLRRRGGRVVLLVDTKAAGPDDRLTGVTDWLAKSENPSVAIVPIGGDSLTLRASEVAWPAVLPAGARPLAWVRDSSSGRPAIWRSPVGAGELVVSGALDAWRYRDPSSSAFEHFWQTLVANEANTAPPALSVRAAQSTLAPGEWTDVTVTSRDAALREAAASSGPPIQSTASASLQADGRRTNIRLWPGSTPGEFRGSLRAPTGPGVYRIVASGDGATAETPIVVAAGASRVAPNEGDLLRAWISSRGGRTILSSQLADLPGILGRALRPSPRSEIWHPMRSVWWLLLFALALSAEWWLRRRRGLA